MHGVQGDVGDLNFNRKSPPAEPEWERATTTLNWFGTEEQPVINSGIYLKKNIDFNV